VFFDAVVALPSSEGGTLLAQEAAAIDWLRDAFGHLKAIGYVETAAPMFAKAGIVRDAGVVDLGSDVPAFIKAAKQHRIWDREPTVRTPR
jgi:catalase